MRTYPKRGSTQGFQVGHYFLVPLLKISRQSLISFTLFINELFASIFWTFNVGKLILNFMECIIFETILTKFMCTMAKSIELRLAKPLITNVTFFWNFIDHHIELINKIIGFLWYSIVFEWRFRYLKHASAFKNILWILAIA